MNGNRERRYMKTRARAALAALSLLTTAAAADTIEVPVLDGDWWRIATDAPDLTPHRIVRDHKSNVCDFTLYPDVHGLWHAVACVRQVDTFGERLFFQWSSDSLTRTDWRGGGLFEVARGRNPDGQPGSVQAPHAFTFNGAYYLFYNSAGAARALTGTNGVAWLPLKNTRGEEPLFRMGRDVMLFHDADRARWVAYYCGNHGPHGAMMARTAPDPAGPWSETETVVRAEGNPESPFVVKRGRAYYLLQQMSVYRSDDPLHFEGRPVNHLTGIWFDGRWAPELVTHAGQDYVAGYGDGIWLAKLRWEIRTPEQQQAWADTVYARILRERAEAAARRAAAPHAKP